MAFTSTLIKREVTGGGKIMEMWSWDATGVTTGTITPDTTDALGIGKIKSIERFTSTVTSTDAALVLTYTNNIARAAGTITCTANSVGVATIEGSAQ
jgi:hypothetical protein